MAIIPTPGLSGGGWLFKAGWRIYDVGLWFTRTGNSLRGVFIVGDYLDDPFVVMGRIFYDISNKIVQADRELSETRDWLYHIINGEGFINLLRWASNELYQIRQNARQWLINHLSAINPEMVVLLFAPKNWLLIQIVRLSPTLADFIYNPNNTVHNILHNFIVWIDEFINNPTVFIISRLSYVMPDIWLFLRNPHQYIYNYLNNQINSLPLFLYNPRLWVIQLLSSQYPEFTLFFNNPKNYLERQIAISLGLPISFWSEPFHYLLEKQINYLSIKLNVYENLIKKLIIDIILIFI